MSNLTNLVFEKNDSDEWLNTLPGYQKDVILDLLKSSSYEEAASIWLEASVDTNAPFSTGTEPTEKKYFNHVKDQVYKLLCGDPQYEADRKEVNDLIQKNVPKETIIASVSAIIGAKVGFAAAFLAPAIVIIFILISKVSLNAWCSMNLERNGGQ